MAVFDLAAQRMCIRVVYDGAASAGKTTNLKQLCGLFATQRSTELYSPGELRGRTLFFDWVQIAAGVACGFPLICQVITVPGQVVLTPRRRQLLASADVVVYVCDSVPTGIARAREGLAVLEEVVHERGQALPIVIQANKQDQPGALDGEAVLAGLERPGLPFLEAIATEGIGVVDTFVNAVRAAVRSLEAMAERGVLRVAVRPSETSSELYARLSGETVDPEWAAEMLLEEASDALLLASHEIAFEAAPAAPPISSDAHDVAGASVPIPHGDVPTGFIWPAHTGRTTLRALAAAGGLSGSLMPDSHGVVKHVAGSHLLRTSTRWRFSEAEGARNALVRAARQRSQLGALLVPDTVLVVQQADDGANWLWTVAANLPSVASRFEDPNVDRELLARCFAWGVGEAIRLSLRHDLYLDCDPESFGELDSVLRYQGDIESIDASERTPAHVILRAIEGLDRLGAPLDPVVDAIEESLREASRGENLAELTRGLRALEAREGAKNARVVAERLAALIARVSEAA